MTELTRESFAKNGVEMVRARIKPMPTAGDFELVYDFSENYAVDIAHVKMSLEICCGWLFGADRPQWQVNQQLTLFERTFASAWCRMRLAEFYDVTAVELAVFVGLTYDSVIRKLRSGELIGTPAAIDPITAREIVVQYLGSV